ncbi:MAG TPA: CRTAC1 family protein [Chthonomonadaceae bacterium]|nr:CRTAC1 family protein [Chthonomonadaceae bacterium]
MGIWLAAGCAPKPPASPAPSAAPLFRDMTAAAGLDFRLGHPSLEHINALETIGHGCAFLDYDGDGRLDILLVGSAGAHLFHNDGNGHFSDVTARALPPPPSHAHFLGCAVADYDNDGHPDIFLTGYGSTALYHNEGNGTFKDVTRDSGLEARGPYDWTTSAAWADLDGTGRLILYVCRYVDFTPQSQQLCPYVTLDGKRIWMSCGPTTYPPLKGSLYRYVGGNRFQEVTAPAGLAVTGGNGLGCMFCDDDDRGRPSLYVANDLKPGDLFANQGGGRFQDIAVEAGVAYGADGQMQSGMGVDWGDYDNDGRFDLLVANFSGQPKSLYHNEGHDTFTNVSYPSGIGAASIHDLAFGAKFIDTQNRGLLDIVFANGHVQSQVEKVDRTTSYFLPTKLYRNLGGGHFADATADAGPDFLKPIVGRGIAVGDFDNDGHEDLLVVNDEGAPLLLHNESHDQNHWITLHCLRAPGKWYAIGTIVTLTLPDGSHRIGEVRAAGSYLSADSPEVHFGLGSIATIPTVSVRWPSGQVSTYRNVPADHAYRLSPPNFGTSPQPAKRMNHPLR